jgi:hypothetical protein
VHLLEKVGPEALRVYAAAMEHRRSFGSWPSASVVAELARREGASVGASLVLTRYELFSETGLPVRLDGEGLFLGPAIVHDAQTLWAIAARGGTPAVRLVAYYGKPIPRHTIQAWARAWDMQAEVEREESVRISGPTLPRAG